MSFIQMTMAAFTYFIMTCIGRVNELITKVVVSITGKPTATALARLPRVVCLFVVLVCDV